MLKLYYANIQLIQEPEVFDKYLKKMNIHRRNKVLRCKNDTDKMRSLLAGVLLREALEQEGLCYDNLVFTQNAHGKPLLEGCEDVFFSISHSGDYIICGIADAEIGVDIENTMRLVLHNPESRLCSIAKKSFSMEEYAFFEQSDDKAACFLKFWTQKESYSKAEGKGLGMDFSQISVLEKDKSGCFWSDWLKEGYYVSIYLEKDSMEAPILVEWKP